MSSAAEPALRLPYPGLRSFQRDESDLFFGREGTVNEMINRLRPNHFLAVLGTSGSGKSSLVRIGLLDGLELGLLAEAGSRWRIADFAPGANPLRNLARELARLGGGSDVDTDFLEAFLARGPRSVVEWCRDGNLPRGANLLLLVDQFEELFRYQGYAERQAAEAFVSLLIESARTREVPIYVVITMRSEFLGACALIEGLAEIINDGQFLTPRLNRDQCREAIVGPAAVCGTVIAEPLVNRLLNDLEDFAPWDDRDSSDQLDRLVRRADQLPLLQHTLNRLWLRADAGRTDKTRQIELRLADYEAIGGLRGAINAHADEVLASLGPGLQRRAEQVFRALTDGKSLATAVRRPLRFDELVAVCDGDEQGVRAVVDAFRNTGVNFLQPDTSRQLTGETIVDISHESLIRQWRHLSAWVLEEAREAQEWTRLGEAAARYRAGEGSLYYGQDLHLWREHARPTAAWAKRYNQPYEETLAFLDQSIGTDRRGRRLRFAAVAAAFIVVVGFGGGGFFVWQLVSQGNRLAEAVDQLAIQKTAAEAATADALQQKAAADAASAALTTLVSAASDGFRASTDSRIADYQRVGDWSAAGALLGAMLRETSHGSGDERAYDRDFVDAISMRLAGQWAFPVWPAIDPLLVLDMPPAAWKAGGRYVVSARERDSGGVRLVDRLTGVVRAEATLPDGETPDFNALHLVTPDGGDAVIVTAANNVFRWRTAENVVVPYGSLGESGRFIRSLALDPEAGLIAAVLYAEDSEVVVLGDDPPGRVFSALLSNLDGMDEPGTADGTGIWFWRGTLVVAFSPDGGPERLAAIDMDDREAWLLPATVTSALPSPDGLRLFLVDSAPCEEETAPYLVDGDGRVRDPNGGYAAFDAAGSLPLPCLRTVGSPRGRIAALGALRAPGAGDASVAMGLAAVQQLDANDGYRLVFEDGTSAEGAATARFVSVDLVADGPDLAPAPGDEIAVGDAAPVVATTGDSAGFVKSGLVEPWRPLPAFGALASIAWSDPASQRLARLAEVVRATDEPTLLAIEPVAAEWPEALGAFEDMGVATAGDALLVVSGRYGGLHWTGDRSRDLELREMTFGGECRLADDETLHLVRLTQWSAAAAPVFFGLDAEGRVLRFASHVTGGAGAGGAGATADRTRVAVRCIGNLRAEAGATALADPARGSVLLQTDPLEFRSIGAAVESEARFSESPRIALVAPSHIAVLVPGDRPLLASLDRAGALSVMRSDPDWRAVNDSRSVIVPAPVHASATGDKLLVVGEAGHAVVVDLATDDLRPVAAGIVPYSPSGYRLLTDGRTVEVMVAGSRWHVPLAPLPSLDDLSRFAEAAAGALTDSFDRNQVVLGGLLTGGGAARPEIGNMALGDDARCYLALNGVLEAWKAEGGSGMPGARLTAARSDVAAQCTGDGSLAAMGRRLAETPHYISPAVDPWPETWSALLHDSIAGNRLASRAILAGLSNSSDAFATAAGGWFANSDAALGLEVPESVLRDAASGLEIDPALLAAVEEQRESYEPAIHEMLGHIAARAGGEVSNLREAWVQFRIAEILYDQQIGRASEADRTAALRAVLARALPADALLDAWREADGWTADIDALPTADVSEPPTSTRERMRADAERLAAIETGGDAPYQLLRAYLWLNLAEIEADEVPDAAPSSYARFAEILSSLPPVSQLSPSLADTLGDVGLRVVELAEAGRLGDAATASRLAPFVFGLAESDEEGTWDAASLNAYATIVGAVAKVLSADPAAVPAETLDRMRFGERRFGHGFAVEDDDTRAAATAALEARLALLDALLERDPSRWDWLAAKGTTKFWIGYRLRDAGDERRDWLSAAIGNLSAARDVAGADFPPESRYWLTEARRWLERGNDVETYLSLTLGGIEDYEVLNEVYATGAWAGPLNRGELLASNTELLAKIADAQADLVFPRGDNWSAADPIVQQQVLDALSTIAEEDRTRRLALDAGSTWSSTNPGYFIAPGYLLGTVGGHFAMERATPDACDRAASFAGDPLRRAPAVAYDDIDFDAALSTCRALWSDARDDPRLNFLLGRLAWSTEESNTLGLDVLGAAAAAGYAPAFNSLAGYLETPGVTIPSGDTIYLDLRFGYAQRVVKAAFADIAAWLRPLAVTAEHRAGLRWLTERAASLGSADAHVAIARLPETTPEDRAYHLEVAAILLEDDGDEEQAEELRAEIPPEDYIDAADRAADEWHVERLVALPPDLIDLLKDATN